MGPNKKLMPFFSLIVCAAILAECDCLGESVTSPDFATSATAAALERTSVAAETQTDVPRQTWTTQARQTLTALPANETATGVAMGATETSAAVATAQLFTREAQTVSANRTVTKLAQERGTNTPTLTPTSTQTFTPSPTLTTTPTSTATSSPTVDPATAVVSSTVLINTIEKLPIDQIFVGESPRRAANNTTDASVIYNPARVDFLKQNGGNTLINNWQTGDTSFTFVGNYLPTIDLMNQWQALSLQNAPATAANDVVYNVITGPGIDEVACKTGNRTISGRQLTTGYCDIFVKNVHFGFNFLTTKEVQQVMMANAPLILKTIADNIE